jgi:hypothetical protein
MWHSLTLQVNVLTGWRRWHPVQVATVAAMMRVSLDMLHWNHWASTCVNYNTLYLQQVWHLHPQ